MTVYVLMLGGDEDFPAGVYSSLARAQAAYPHTGKRGWRERCAGAWDNGLRLDAATILSFALDDPKES